MMIFKFLNFWSFLLIFNIFVEHDILCSLSPLSLGSSNRSSFDLTSSSSGSSLGSDTSPSSDNLLMVDQGDFVRVSLSAQKPGWLTWLLPWVGTNNWRSLLSKFIKKDYPCFTVTVISPSLVHIHRSCLVHSLTWKCVDDTQGGKIHVQPWQARVTISLLPDGTYRLMTECPNVDYFNQYFPAALRKPQTVSSLEDLCDALNQILSWLDPESYKYQE